MIKYLEQRFQITDNGYADIILGFIASDADIRERFGEVNYQIIDERTVILYLPVQSLHRGSIHQLRYSAFPKLYGLQNLIPLEASGISRLQNISGMNYQGKGVLIGMLDTGIDYTNPLFRREDGKTRIMSIWDQTIESNSYSKYNYYGTEYKENEINSALLRADPYAAVPSRDENGHGTFLAGIAAGGIDNENGFRGVVPEAEFLIVKLKEAKQYFKEFFCVPDSAACYQETDIIQAVRYLFFTAREMNRPIVIFIALGSNQGAHAGAGALDLYLSSVGDVSGVILINAAGNEGEAEHHYYGEIPRSTLKSTVELMVSDGVEGFAMEIWGRSPGTYSIDITTPSGEYISRIPARLNERRDIRMIFEPTQISVDYQVIESRTGEELILLRFRNPASGIWRIGVYGEGDLPLIFHCWLPLSDFLMGETKFLTPDPFTTLTPPGTSAIPITVTAYNVLNQQIFQSGGRGFTYYDSTKPDFAAPGVDMSGPLLAGGYGAMSGTSAAAAFTAGAAAILLEWGVINGNYRYMDSIEAKKLFIRGCRRRSGVIYPDKQWGYGMLDLYHTYETLRDELSNWGEQ